MTDTPPLEGNGQAAATARAAQWATWLLISIALFNYIDRQVLAAVVPYIKTAFFSDPAAMQTGVAGAIMHWFTTKFGFAPENAMVSLLSTAFLGTYFVMAPIFGLMRVNRWYIIAAGVAVWSIASGATGLAATFGFLLLTRCFVGVGEAAYGPVAPTILSDLFPIETRGKIMSRFYMTIPVGSALGFGLGGFMVWLTGDWRWAFYVVVVPGIVLAFLCLRMQEPRSGQSDAVDDAQAHKPSLRDYIHFFKNPSFVIDTIGQTLMTFAIGGIGFWMPDYIHEYRGGGSVFMVNIIFGAVLVVSGFLGTMAGGWAGDKLRARWSGSYFLVSGIAMLVGFPFFAWMLILPFPWAWGCIFVGCFCLFFNTGPSNTILANVTHPALRASAFAVNIFIIHAFGDVISPLVIGAITDATGSMSKAFFVVSLLVLAGGAVWLCGIPFLKRDEERAARQLEH